MFVWVVLAFSVIMHEYVHGWVAYLLGDPTARSQGRLTLNPLPHIDPFMTIILPIVTFYFWGFPFGGAKPVPVNPLNFRDPRKGMMIVGAAGPATNLALGVGFALFYHLLRYTGLFNEATAVALVLAVLLNGLLAFFNLIPIPPLDGSRIVAGVLPREAALAYDRVAPFGVFIVVGFMIVGGFKLLLPVLKAWSLLLGMPAVF
jgi:Zn-dependent protease